MKLLIDCTERGKIIFNEQKAYQGSTEQTLYFLDKFLKNQKVKIEELERVGVVVGPGSFTALRMSVAVANALGYALKIPLYSFKKGEKIDFSKKKKQKTLKPFYNQEPNITKSKK